MKPKDKSLDKNPDEKFRKLFVLIQTKEFSTQIVHSNDKKRITVFF